MFISCTFKNIQSILVLYKQKKMEVLQKEKLEQPELPANANREDYYSIQELSKKTGIALTTLYTSYSKGESLARAINPHAFKRGREKFFVKSEIDKLVNEGKTFNSRARKLK